MRLRTLSPTAGAAASAKIPPRLFWYQSKPSGGKLLLVLRDGKSTRKMAEILIQEDLPAGTQSMEVPGEVHFEPGGVYIWTITYKPTPDALRDVTARGELLILKNGADILKEVESLAPRERIFRLAAAGAWYDVLAGIEALREDGAELDAELQKLWDENLKQAGLAFEGARDTHTTTPP